MQPYYTTIPTTSGIYRIVCVPTGKFYIGSAVNLRKRYSDHFTALRHNTHFNPKMQHAFNKYTEQSFTFEVLEIVLIPEMLTMREQYYFDTLKPFGKRGFNTAITAGSQLGMKASAETRKRLSISHMGNTSALGHKCTPETLALFSKLNKGKPKPHHPGYVRSPEHCKKLGQANLGKKQSDETKRKRAQKAIGRKQSPEAVEKTRLANTWAYEYPRSM